MSQLPSKPFKNQTQFEQYFGENGKNTLLKIFKELKIPMKDTLLITIQENRTSKFFSMVVDFSRKKILPNDQTFSSLFFFPIPPKTNINSEWLT